MTVIRYSHSCMSACFLSDAPCCLLSRVVGAHVQHAPSLPKSALHTVCLWVWAVICALSLCPSMCESLFSNCPMPLILCRQVLQSLQPRPQPQQSILALHQHPLSSPALPQCPRAEAAPESARQPPSSTMPEQPQRPILPGMSPQQAATQSYSSSRMPHKRRAPRPRSLRPSPTCPKRPPPALQPHLPQQHSPSRSRRQAARWQRPSRWIIPPRLCRCARQGSRPCRALHQQRQLWCIPSRPAKGSSIAAWVMMGPLAARLRRHGLP